MKHPDENPPVPATACQVCGEPLAPTDTVWCEKCNTPHHPACWRYNKGCSTFGCGYKTYTAESPPAPSPVHDPHKLFVFTSCPGGTLVPISALLCMLLFQVIFSRGLSLVSFTLGLVIVLIPFIIVLRLPWKVAVVPAEGRVERRLVLLGITLSRDANWLALEDVAEVFLYPRARVEFALTDGQRIRVVSRALTSPEEMKVVAEHAATALGTTVRVVTGEPPTADEIRQIGREAMQLRLEERKAKAEAQERIEEKPKA